MKKAIKQMYRQILLLAVMLTILLSVQPVLADEQEVIDPDKIVIGVSVYNNKDAEVQAFRRYFEQYIGLSFDADFLYSGKISTAEEEAEFIRKLHERGVKGVISFVSSYAETSVPLCDSLGMYYISGSGTLSDKIFQELKEYPTFLGTIGPNAQEEEKAGTWIAEHFASEDQEKKENYLVYTGGSSFGNEMHRLRAVGILETLDQTYGLPSEKTCEEWAESEEITEITTDCGTTILLYPGYSDTMEDSTELFSERTYDNALSVAMFSGLMDVIMSAEDNTKANIRVGMVGCFTEETSTWFNTKDAYGDTKINCLVGKYGATVAPSFVAMMNAYTGHAETFRDHGDAFELYQSFWYAANAKEFNDQYSTSEGIAVNTYSAVEMFQNLCEYNENANFEQFRLFTER